MIEWKPFPKQELALKRVAFETLFGGARGPGKTDTGLVWLLKPFSDPTIPPESLARYRALVIRKNSNDLTDWLDRASWMYSAYGAIRTSEYNSPAIKFPSGAKIRTGHLKDSQAYTKYIGHEYQRMLIEELNQIKEEQDYLKLISSCRSTLQGLEPRVFATTNPGGLGHVWIKKRFIDVAPWGQKFVIEEHVGERTIQRSRLFIHSTMDDNPRLMEMDPGYVLSIEALKQVDPETYKAWRFGDWDVFAGMFFHTFRRNLHVCLPFVPDTKNCVIIAGLDWGYHAPFSFHASEVKKVLMSDGTFFYRTRTFLEVYLTNRHPSEAAQEIIDKLKFFGLTLDSLAWIQADPAIFNKGTDGSMSIRDQFIRANPGYFKLRKGSNDRVPGWAIMRNWLSIAPDKEPYWQMATTCTALIEEISSAVYNEKKIEDLEAEKDHALDDCRYMLKGLKWVAGSVGAAKHTNTNRTIPVTAQFIDQKQISMDIDAWADPHGALGSIGGVPH